MKELHPPSNATLDVAQYALFAQAAGPLKAKLREVLDLLMLFGFLYGVVLIIGGALQIRRGETEGGKNSIIAGALIAAAPLIMRILFEILFEQGKGVF